VSSANVILVLAVFGASVVEAVEALTLVIAAGTTRSWRSAYEGAAVAFGLLAVLTVAVGVPLIKYVPIDALRVIIGALLLVLGLGWLRKSILRASGHKALHDEDLIYKETVAELSTGNKPNKGRDGTAFKVAFTGVLLEGTEVVLIVLSLGAAQHRLGLAALAAAAAVIVVTLVGIVVARQLREVPENTLKLGVGIMLSAFGVFWVGEGSNLNWPGKDLAILVLIAIFLVVTFVAIRVMRNMAPPAPTTAQPVEQAQTA
jgi:uncharacterized membrane protein